MSCPNITRKNYDMSHTHIKGIRKALRTLLPNAIERAVESYEAFATQLAPTDPKKFSAHHTACKSALSHLDYLTKLAKWVESQSISQSKEKDESLEPLILEARSALLDYDCTNAKEKGHHHDK